MNEILKLQADLIKEMQKTLKIVQEEMENKETVTYRADKASTVLVRLAMTFEKTQPKYITLPGKGQYMYSDTDSLPLIYKE